MNLSGVAPKSVAEQRINALLHFQERCFGTVRATCAIIRRARQVEGEFAAGVGLSFCYCRAIF